MLKGRRNEIDKVERLIGRGGVPLKHNARASRSRL